MNDLAGAAGLLALIVTVAILIGGVMGFARWAVSRLVSGAVWSVRALLWMISAGSRRVSLALQKATAYAVRQSWRAFRGAVRHVSQGLRRGVSGLGAAIHNGWKASPDKREEATASSGKFDARSPTSGDASDGNSEAEAAYRQALDLMGLTGVEPLTNALLRQRYGELIRIVHPNSGLPTNVFAQQVNAAVTVIKGVHGWR